MVQQNPENNVYSYTPDNIHDPEVVEQIMRDPGLAEMAGDNDVYLRHLQDEKIAALRMALDPTNEEVQQHYKQAHSTLQIYEDNLRLRPKFTPPSQ